MVVPLTLGDKCHVDYHIILDGTLRRRTPHSSDFFSLSSPPSLSLSLSGAWWWREQGAGFFSWGIKHRLWQLSSPTSASQLATQRRKTERKRETKQRKEKRGWFINTEGRWSWAERDGVKGMMKKALFQLISARRRVSFHHNNEPLIGGFVSERLRIL